MEETSDHIKKDNTPLRSVIKEKGVALPIAGSVLANIAVWIYCILSISAQEDIVYLHYNIYFGVDLIGNPYQFFLMPAAGTAMIILNILAIVFFKKSGYPFRTVIAYATLLVQFFLVYGIYLIIQLNV